MQKSKLLSSEHCHKWSKTQVGWVKCGLPFALLKVRGRQQAMVYGVSYHARDQGVYRLVLHARACVTVVYRL